MKALNDFEPIAVEGEVSQYRVSQGQWVSFDLKDDVSLVNIFMPIWKLKVPIEDGMKVRVHGAGRVYAKYGKFSISAELIELVGEGALRKALAALRARLDAEGLFDPARKRELPRFPARIALIASTESAAYGDFVRIIRERWPLLKIDAYHVLVQGERAPDDIVKAIQQAQERHESAPYDALVITRGGGSFDELMAFNNERLARAIRGSKIPTLVAIGHERDISIAEDVADVRGSTPTDAARRLVPDQKDVEYELAAMVERASRVLDRGMDDARSKIDRVLDLGSRWLTRYRVDIDRCATAITQRIEQRRVTLAERLESTVRLLSSLDPTSVMKRGYAIVKDASGHAVTSVERLSRGQAIEVGLKDGVAGATVQVVRKTT
jgi:exodeoxyribonuclease VII large subunit